MLQQGVNPQVFVSGHSKQYDFTWRHTNDMAIKDYFFKDIDRLPVLDFDPYSLHS